MTAYRYIRLGKLSAHKQGRDWRIKKADLDLLVANATDSGSVAESADWMQRFYNRVMAFDDKGAWLTVEAAMASGLDPIQAYTTVVSPALFNAGDQWSTGAVSVAESHAATTVCRNVVGRLSLHSSRRGISKGTIVLACPQGERHQLPAAIAAGIFKASGYETVNCGAGVPLPAFVELVAATPRLIAVGISATMPDTQLAIAEMTTAVKDQMPEATVMVGGSVVETLEPGETLGAEIVAPTALTGLAELQLLDD